MADPEDGPARIDDDLAESLAEEYLRAATTGEEHSDEAHEELVDEELGGPFIQTSAAEEFGHVVDPMPDDWEREALPQAMSGLIEMPVEAGEVEDDDGAGGPGDETADNYGVLVAGEASGPPADQNAYHRDAVPNDYQGPNPPRIRASRTPSVQARGRR